MILQIADILTPPEIEAVREAAGAAGFWSDGAATAAGRAKAAKNNQQALAPGPAKGVIDLIASRILAHETVQSAAQPAAFARIMLNRYGEGMEYGAHVDAAYIDGVRTDLSFTLFLSDPDSYEGGDLLIESAGAEDQVKLPAGSLVLYPPSSIHRVTRVIRGERIAAVGWIKSRVRDAHARQMIFELERAMADLAAMRADGDVGDRLANLRNNLLRRWGE